MDRASLEEAEIAAQGLGRKIAGALPKGWGFTLLLWTKGDGEGRGFMSYLSNAQREDMIQAMRELLAKWESGEPGV